MCIRDSTHVVQGARDKRVALLDLAERIGIDPAAMAYMGDDVVDLPPMVLCGLTLSLIHISEPTRPY